MKFTCEKYLLQQAVNTAARAAAAKSPIPALEGLLIEAGNDVKVTGYDLKKGVYTSFLADVARPGCVVLGAKIFGEIVRSLPDGIVTVDMDEKLRTTIRCGSAEFSILGLDAQDYPELPTVDMRNTVSVEQRLLRRMIGETLFAVSDNESRPIYTGSLFEVGEDALTVVSVDGYRLAIREEPVQANEEASFVVPGKTLNEVTKLLSDSEEETLSLVVGRRHILFKIGNYTVISRLLEGEFLDYKAAIPAASSTEVLVNTRSFIESVERVSLLITDRLKSPVRCLFEDNDIKLSCSTSMGRANDQFEAQITGSNVEIGFNNRYLLDALRNAEGDEVKVQLNGPLSPMKVLPREGNAFLFLVLPVRLKSDS